VVFDLAMIKTFFLELIKHLQQLKLIIGVVKKLANPE